MAAGGAVWLGIYEWTIHELMQKEQEVPRVIAGVL